jgi:hypothetical protein
MCLCLTKLTGNFSTLSWVESGCDLSNRQYCTRPSFAHRSLDNRLVFQELNARGWREFALTATDPLWMYTRLLSWMWMYVGSVGLQILSFCVYTYLRFLLLQWNGGIRCIMSQTSKAFYVVAVLLCICKFIKQQCGSGRTVITAAQWICLNR